MKDLEEILKGFASSAYWYAEETGDYDMSNVDNQDFFIGVVKQINERQVD